LNYIQTDKENNTNLISNLPVLQAGFPIIVKGIMPIDNQIPIKNRVNLSVILITNRYNKYFEKAIIHKSDLFSWKGDVIKILDVIKTIQKERNPIIDIFT